MIKKFLGATLAAFMMITIPAASFAQPGGGRKEPGNQKARMECMAPGDSAQCKIARENCFKEFEGIKLTDAQKEQLKALKQERKAKMDARRDSMKNEARKMEKKREEMKNQKEADRREYLNKVKNIIGADNYVIYLENQFVQESGRPDMGKDFGPKGPGREGMRKPGCDRQGKKGFKKQDCDKQCNKECDKQDCDKQCKKECKKQDCDKQGKKDKKNGKK